MDFEARVPLTGVEKSVQLAGSMQVVGDHLQKGKKKAPRDATLDAVFFSTTNRMIDAF